MYLRAIMICSYLGRGLLLYLPVREQQSFKLTPIDQNSKTIWIQIRITVRTLEL